MCGDRMQTDNILPNGELPCELLEQLGVIEQSQWYIIVLAAATLLSHCTTQLQKQQLLCSALPQASGCDEITDPYPIQLTSSAMIIGALIYFYQLSAQALAAPKETPLQCASSWRGFLSNSLVLAAALIRLYDLKENHDAAALSAQPILTDLEPPL